MKIIRQSVYDMHGYTPGEQPQGNDRVIKLNTNENPYPPSLHVDEALRSIDTSILRLYPDPLSIKLRVAIADLHGCGIENVFVGNGADELLALCTRAFVENDDSVGYFEPSYSLYPVLSDIRDVAKVPVVLDQDFGFVQPDDSACSLFFMTNPNAPTSILYSRANVEKFCSDFQGVVVLDEAYVDFADENCMDIALTLPNVLVARTLSKSYSMAGLRLGYAVGDKLLIEALNKIKDSYNLNAITQTLALAAILDQDHMRANVERIKTTRARFLVELEDIGFTVVP
ncbi:MAG: aminotransferase class I/II-fold pyridoxal phosphate-dependent enzyme, partial [Kiritimatiellae bacterium]|nr:aminotransferase class I/II-fold pyridoxal phosphate-dependent enzyme [Kiritimatiellia bacterium]